MSDALVIIGSILFGWQLRVLVEHRRSRVRITELPPATVRQIAADRRANRIVPARDDFDGGETR